MAFLLRRERKGSCAEKLRPRTLGIYIRFARACRHGDGAKKQIGLCAKVMENVHLAPEGDGEDLYSGYDYNDPMLEVHSLRSLRNRPRVTRDSLSILISAQQPFIIVVRSGVGGRS